MAYDSLVEPSEVLGVAPGAPPEEIRRAFAARARAVHPDVVGVRYGAGEELAGLVMARDALLGRATAPSRCEAASAPAAPGATPGTARAGQVPGTSRPGQVPVGALLVRAVRRFVATWRSYDEPSS